MADKYIATQPLFVGEPLNQVRAHNVGDEVPEANIERNGWQDSVAKAESAAGQAAIEEAAPASWPAKNATKSDWVEAAVNHGGMSQEEADGLTRDELASRFGG